jgi:hypothetical protein
MTASDTLFAIGLMSGLCALVLYALRPAKRLPPTFTRWEDGK